MFDFFKKFNQELIANDILFGIKNTFIKEHPLLDDNYANPEPKNSNTIVAIAQYGKLKEIGKMETKLAKALFSVIDYNKYAAKMSKEKKDIKNLVIQKLHDFSWKNIYLANSSPRYDDSSLPRRQCYASWFDETPDMVCFPEVFLDIEALKHQILYALRDTSYNDIVIGGTQNFDSTVSAEL